MSGDGSDADDGPADGRDGDAARRPDDPGVDDAGEPLADLAERVRDSGDLDESELPDAFESVTVEDVDTDQLFDELEAGVEGAVAPPRFEADRDVEAVPKRQYCQRCRFFSEPPEVKCTHEDGEILEVVDTETFRIADCPILEGEEELEGLGK